MFCNIVPDKVLKRLGDKHTIRKSNSIRFSRLKKNLKTLVQAVPSFFTYTCKNGTDLPGVPADLGRDIQALEAQKGANDVYKFFLNKFNRNSLDNSGMDIISSVHFGQDYNNAYYNGSQMVYGDSDHQLFLPFTKGLDVIAHELSHCVTEHTADLNYWGESGALNESFSDIFGIAIKYYYTRQENPHTSEWLIGSDIVGPKFPGKGLRSFKNEKAYDQDSQPKHMKNYRWTFKDNGGVHDNSGIFNFAFYNICINLNEPPFGKPIRIMYDTLLKLGKFSNFKKAAKTAVQEAAKYNASAEVLAAFKTVGIL